MSSSNAAPEKEGLLSEALSTRKVILGPASSGHLSEMTLMELEGKVKAPTWDEAMQSEYMDRVRAKAAAKAREIVEQANAEAARLKQQGFDEGLAEGRAQAEQELTQALEQVGTRLAGLLNVVEADTPKVLEKHRQDLVDLVRLAAEKVIGVELGERRSEILEALLDQAVDQLESHRRITVRVHPEDAEIMAELLAHAKERHPELQRWRVEPEPSMAPGGLVVESDLGKADSTVDTRLAIIRSVFDQVSLSEED